MGNITLEQAAQWCGGRVEEKYREVAFCGANIDSRKILPGQLFVALEGVRDGHEFIPMAMENGASAVLCKHCQADIPAIIVEDPRIALGKIAGGYRQQRDMKVVGVTGSVGKSTRCIGKAVSYTGPPGKSYFLIKIKVLLCNYLLEKKNMYMCN